MGKKRMVCSKCGMEHKDFYVNPICFCGHQIRELTNWEKYMLKNSINNDEYKKLSALEKREIFREIEWSVSDVKWQLGIAVCLLILYLYFILSVENLVLILEYKMVAILVILVGIVLLTKVLFVIAKTGYFWYLGKRDCKQFGD